MYAQIFTDTWSMFQNTLTINGFTFSYAQVYIFSLVCILLVRAALIFLDIRG